MKVLIATPAYGGLLTTKYVGSLLDSLPYLRERGHTVDTFFLSNESLITRGRDRCARAAMSGGYDKLIFIDADISWKPEQLRKLIDCEKDIVGGTYPVKTYPIRLNHNPLPDIKTNPKDPLIPVAHLATGFLAITHETLERLSLHATKYWIDGEQYFEFFPCAVSANGQYMSEDWAFCEAARSIGIPVYLHTDCVVDHTGAHTYSFNPGGN